MDISPYGFKSHLEYKGDSRGFASAFSCKKMTQIYLFPIDSLVIFNFVKANELSMALNTLTELVPPPKGDSIHAKNYAHSF